MACLLLDWKRYEKFTEREGKLLITASKKFIFLLLRTMATSLKANASSNGICVSQRRAQLLYKSSSSLALSKLSIYYAPHWRRIRCRKDQLHVVRALEGVVNLLRLLLLLQ